MDFKALSKLGETAQAVFNQVQILEAHVKKTTPIKWKDADTSTRRRYRAMVLWQALHGNGENGVDVRVLYEVIRKYHGKTVRVFSDEKPQAMLDFELASPLFITGLELQNEFIRHTYHNVHRLFWLSNSIFSKNNFLDKILLPDQWDDATIYEQIDSVYVEEIIDMPYSPTTYTLLPEHIHARWCRRMMEQGWVYDLETNLEEKKHDMIVQYRRLTEREKQMYKVFTS